jgi:hypothetical protein
MPEAEKAWDIWRGGIEGMALIKSRDRVCSKTTYSLIYFPI